VVLVSLIGIEILKHEIFFPILSILSLNFFELEINGEKISNTKDGFGFTKGIVPAAFLFTQKVALILQRVLYKHPFSQQRLLLFH